MPERVAEAAKKWAQEYCDFATGKRTGVKVGKGYVAGTCAAAVSDAYTKQREETL